MTGNRDSQWNNTKDRTAQDIDFYNKIYLANRQRIEEM